MAYSVPLGEIFIDKSFEISSFNLKKPLKSNKLLFRFAVMFFIMPETEHRSLEDIELHYSDNSRGITAINIHISAKSNIKSYGIL